MAVPQWAQEIFRAIDEMDAEKFVSFLTEDATFVFGNNPPVTGNAAIKEAVQGFFSSINGLSHTLTKSWMTEDAIIFHGMVTYTRKDDSTVELPFANIFEMKGDKIQNYLIFMDVNPLFAPPEE